MAFTRDEFLRGAFGAWGWYLVSVVVCALLFGFLMVPFALIYAVPVSFIALLAWAPFAYILGQALRRVQRLAVHLIAFGMFGAVLGAVTMLLFTGFMTGFQTSSWDGLVFYAPFALTPAVTVPFAWWRTARRALRFDRGETPISQPDPDAPAEDAVVIRLTERTDEFDAR
jgi:hypothetical protein